MAHATHLTTMQPIKATCITLITNLFPLITTLLSLLPISSEAKGEDHEMYLYTSFHEPSTDGLRYLYSEDGLHWDSIPGVWLAPKQGKVMRDPSIIMGLRQHLPPRMDCTMERKQDIRICLFA